MNFRIVLASGEALGVTGSGTALGVTGAAAKRGLLPEGLIANPLSAMPVSPAVDFRNLRRFMFLLLSIRG